MISQSEFLEFAVDVLGVESGSISPETTYGSIPEWDSMAQLRLVTEGSAKYGVEIPFAEVTNVTSLWDFYRRFNGLSPKKVVAVDLDNTLWEGVVGEDGVDDIRPNVDLLGSLKSLKSRGILLVILSKNDEKDGLAGLERLRREELLSKDDFVTWRIDWNEKADNLRSVAAELNLGTDAFVFVDDNPAERLKMRTLLPEVAVAAFPPNLAAYFPEGAVTEEDRRKTEEYRAEANRKKHLNDLGLTSTLDNKSSSVDGQRREAIRPPDVWAALGCRMDVRAMAADEVSRVAQLSQKANRFNVRTRRRSEDEVRRLAAEGLVATCRVRDDFGDMGLVAFAIVTPDGDGTWSVTDWVMSCRVAGRGLEERFEESLERLLRERNVRTLRATWEDSGKNSAVSRLFDELSFGLTESTPSLRRYCKIISRCEAGCWRASEVDFVV